MKYQLTTRAIIAIVACTVMLIWASGCSKKSTNPDNACLDDNGDPLPVRPESERVDLYTPVFTNPTSITNPLFPVSSQHSYVMLGLSDGEPFRTEVTLLPGTKTIVIDNKNVQALVSQYCAFLDGRIHEVAIDWYAQDDRGAVWYLGEDVFNYENGDVADRHGTWLAGAEGPAAMIMPASPQIGDVYRPENACGVVFEEVTIQETGVTVAGPRGQVTGAIEVEELHMDATREGKIFAPGYGEFSTGSGNNVEAMALAVPTDALAGSMPSALSDLIEATNKVFNAADANNWSEAASGLSAVVAGWAAYQANQIPARLGAQMSTAIAAMTIAVNAHSTEDSRQTAIDVARATYDFELRYQIPAEIDIARFELWARQVLVDAAAGEADNLRGDVTALEWTRDRFNQTLGASSSNQINAKLVTLRTAANAGNLASAATAAEELRAIIEEL